MSGVFVFCCGLLILMVAGNGVNAPVNALTVHDDGGGPTLFAGGVFSNAGGLPVHFLARWDGTTWSPVEGSTGNGVNSTIRYLGSFNDGHGPALYGGGWFLQAGGLSRTVSSGGSARVSSPMASSRGPRQSGRKPLIESRAPHERARADGM